MKRIIKLLFLLIIIFTHNAFASSGPIKQNSVIECDGKYYGNHGNPLHWHEVVKKDGKWVSISKETSIPACYIKPVNEMEKVKLSKCGDGDTARFIIKNEEKKVRFLAIDTPEVDKNDPYSREAKEYTCNKLKQATEIYLEYDSNSDKEDKYGRVLAFVHVDGVLLEKDLIEHGYAKVAYIYGDYNYVEELRKVEEVAKNNKIGIWEEVLGDKEETKVVEEDNIVLRIFHIIIGIMKLLFDLFMK
jgi:micrococcal nuclease